MANTFSYASVFQKALDEQMLTQLTSRAMEAQASQVKYTGGNEVKILKIVMEGLGDYNRSTGFPSGDISSTWETHTFDKDRGKQFNIDAQDNDEQFVDVAGALMAEFQKVHVAPEVDAYRYSAIWAKALADSQVGRYTADKSDIFEQLKADISDIQDNIGESEPLTIYMSFNASKELDLADKIEHKLDVATMSIGGIETRVRALDGLPIVKVPSARFKTEYTFSATDGFTPTALASDINWIIAANKAVIAITKTEKVRTFTPDQNQDADAWKMQYRKYHTLIIPDNKMVGVYVNYAGVDAPALTATVAGGSAGGTTSFTATPTGGNTLGYILGATSPGVKYLDLIDDFSGSVEPYTSGADIAATAGQVLTMCEVDTAGRIVLVLEQTLAAGDIT